MISILTVGFCFCFDLLQQNRDETMICRWFRSIRHRNNWFWPSSTHVRKYQAECTGFSVSDSENGLYLQSVHPRGFTDSIV